MGIILVGNAIGFGVTTLALCDIVYSVPGATFNTPFMKFAFCAEGCSSVLFPRIMGISKANEMLVSFSEMCSHNTCILILFFRKHS
jgi:enoyl-CoA hydratase/carnithine racemase